MWRHYNFTVGGSLLPVCKSFLIHSEHWHCLHPACSWKVYRWNFHRGRKKGKHTPSNKIPEKKSLLKKLIESFPAVESRHGRKGADKQKNNNNKKPTSNPVCSSVKCTKWMLKKERTRGPSRCPAASTVTFVTDYNLAFHRPNEDQCLLCPQLCKWWRNKFIVSGHEGEVQRAPKEKTRIKSWKRRRLEKRAKADGSLYVATFDMQAVLQTPRSAVA